MHRNAAAELDDLLIEDKRRCGDYHLVSGIDDAHKCREQGLCGTGGDNHLALVTGKAMRLCLICGYALPQLPEAVVLYVMCLVVVQ